MIYLDVSTVFEILRYIYIYIYTFSHAHMYIYFRMYSIYLHVFQDALHMAQFTECKHPSAAGFVAPSLLKVVPFLPCCKTVKWR